MWITDAIIKALANNFTNCLVITTRKSMSVKGEVHERFRKKAAKMTTKDKRVTIADLLEVVSKHLDEITLIEEAELTVKGQ